MLQNEIKIKQIANSLAVAGLIHFKYKKQYLIFLILEIMAV
jgi:hypothetical protein